MLMVPPTVRVFLATAPCDMRSTFVLPKPQAGKVLISAQQLGLLLDGLDWQRLPARRALKVRAAA